VSYLLQKHIDIRRFLSCYILPAKDFPHPRQSRGDLPQKDHSMKCENYFDPFYLQLYFTILNTGLAAFKFREKTQRKKNSLEKVTD
jgi:hypothetical protein